MALAAMTNSPPAPVRAVRPSRRCRRRAAPGRAAATSGTAPGRRGGRRAPRRRPAARRCRPARRAARNALSRPKPAIPARCSHGTSNGPSQVSGPRWTSGTQQPARHRCRAPRRATAADAAEHERAAEDDAARLLRRAARRPPSGPGCAAACGRRPRTPGRPAAPPRAAPSPRSARATATVAVVGAAVAATSAGHLRGRRRVGDHRPRRDGGADVVELAHRRPRDRAAVDQPRRWPSPVVEAEGAERARRRSGRSRTWSTRRCPTIVGSAGRRPRRARGRRRRRSPCRARPG